jgi:putative thioredoxin
VTTPRNRQQAAAGLQAAAAMTGAVDLSALAAKADAARRAPAAAPAGAAAGGEPGGGPVLVTVTDASFESEVIVRSQRQLVVVALTASWSEPSQQLLALLAAMAQRDGRWVLAEIDAEANPGIAQAFGVKSVPMVVAVAAGQPVAAFDGVAPEDQIAGWLDQIFAKVGGALAGAEPAASSVRNLEFILRAQAHDPAIVETAAPRDLDAQLAAADVLLLSQQPEAAFERLLAAVRGFAGDERDRARKRLLELFELFEPADPMVVAARKKLALALY